MAQIKISESFMQDGLIFIWVPKGKYLSQVIKGFERQDFYYVENLCFVMMNDAKKDGKFES